MIIKFNFEEMESVKTTLNEHLTAYNDYKTKCGNEISKFDENWTDFRGENFVNVYESSYLTFLTKNIQALEKIIDFIPIATDKYEEAESNVVSGFAIK